MKNEDGCEKKICIDGTVKVFAGNDAVFVYGCSTPDDMKSIVLKDFAKDNGICKGEYKASLNIEFASKPDDYVTVEDVRVGNVFFHSGKGSFVTVNGFSTFRNSPVVYCNGCGHMSFDISLLRRVWLSKIDLEDYGFDSSIEGMATEPEYTMFEYGLDGEKYGISIRIRSGSYFLSVASVNAKDWKLLTLIDSIRIQFMDQLQNILYDNFGIKLVRNSGTVAEDEQKI